MKSLDLPKLYARIRTGLEVTSSGRRAPHWQYANSGWIAIGSRSKFYRHGTHELTSARLIAWQLVQAYVSRALDPMYFEDSCIISIPRHFPALFSGVLVHNSISENHFSKAGSSKRQIGRPLFQQG